MKKSNFTARVLGTVGVVIFALGMCMGLLPEWDMFRQGVVCGVIGLVILLITVIVWRKMEGKAPIQLNARTIGSVLVGVLGALLLGVGMCLSMVFGKMALGIVVGLVGIVALLMLIPLTKGIHLPGPPHSAGRSANDAYIWGQAALPQPTETAAAGSRNSRVTSCCRVTGVPGAVPESRARIFHICRREIQAELPVQSASLLSAAALCRRSRRLPFPPRINLFVYTSSPIGTSAGGSPGLQSL